MEKIRYLVLGICVAAFLFSFIEYTDAQSESSKSIIPDEGVFIFVQTLVENSNGQIVTYLASDKFSDIRLQELESLLDAEESESDPVINIGDKKYQVIKRQLTITYDKENVIASTMMAHTQNDELSIVARFAHDGYPIVEGDIVRSVWTFIRPVE